MTAVEERCKYKWICVDIVPAALKVWGVGWGRGAASFFLASPPRNNFKISIYPNEIIKNKWVAALMMT